MKVIVISIARINPAVVSMSMSPANNGFVLRYDSQFRMRRRLNGFRGKFYQSKSRNCCKMFYTFRCIIYRHTSFIILFFYKRKHRNLTKPIPICCPFSSSGQPHWFANILRARFETVAPFQGASVVVGSIDFWGPHLEQPKN